MAVERAFITQNQTVICGTRRSPLFVSQVRKLPSVIGTFCPMPPPAHCRRQGRLGCRRGVPPEAPAEPAARDGRAPVSAPAGGRSGGGPFSWAVPSTGHAPVLGGGP